MDTRDDLRGDTDMAPYCLDLRSKKLMFRTLPPREESDVLDASRHCWCGRTQQILGPDGEVVSPDDCRTGRECFRGVFSAARGRPTS